MESITDAGLKDELPEDDCHVTLMKLSERMDKRVLEIRNTAIECIVLAAMRKVLCRAKPEPMGGIYRQKIIFLTN